MLPADLTAPLVAYAGTPGPGRSLAVSVGGAPFGSTGFLVVGFVELSVPVAGGVLVASPDAVIGPFPVPNVVIGEQIGLTLPDVDLGVDVFVQWWFVDDGDDAATSAVLVDG